MIRANIAELKNRLSHYLRLVKGGEVIEVMDRKTPLARIAKVGILPVGDDRDAWVHEMCDLGIVVAPREPLQKSQITDPSNILQTGSGTLQALIDERATGR